MFNIRRRKKKKVQSDKYNVINDKWINEAIYFKEFQCIDITCDICKYDKLNKNDDCHRSYIRNEISNKTKYNGHNTNDIDRISNEELAKIIKEYNEQYKV